MCTISSVAAHCALIFASFSAHRRLDELEIMLLAAALLWTARNPLSHCQIVAGIVDIRIGGDHERCAGGIIHLEAASLTGLEIYTTTRRHVRWCRYDGVGSSEASGARPDGCGLR